MIQCNLLNVTADYLTPHAHDVAMALMELGFGDDLNGASVQVSDSGSPYETTVLFVGLGTATIVKRWPEQVYEVSAFHSSGDFHIERLSIQADNLHSLFVLLRDVLVKAMTYHSDGLRQRLGERFAVAKLGVGINTPDVGVYSNCELAEVRPNFWGDGAPGYRFIRKDKNKFQGDFWLRKEEVPSVFPGWMAPE